MTGAPIPSIPLRDLAPDLTGRVVVPGDPDYVGLATPWNLAQPAVPLAVVEVANADDVAATLRFAAQYGVRVAVRATGHGAVSDLADAILVHTRRLDECTVHAEGWARVGAGVRWARVLEEAAPFGLAPLAGSAPDVGVAGYLTGGGLGPVARTYGVASDRIRAIDVVTGDGRIRRATATEEPDLFWALRGGKGTAGVVTAVETDLVRLGELYGGAYYADGAAAAALLALWRSWCEDLPLEATTSFAIFNLPSMPGIPEILANRTSVAVRFAWSGDAAEGARVFQPIRDAAPALIDAVAVMPYAALGMIHADPVDPIPAHETAALLRELPDAAIETLLGATGPGSGSPFLLTELRQLGGRIADADAPPSAFCQRDAAYHLFCAAIDIPPTAEPVRAASAAVLEAMSPWSLPGRLPNFSPSVDPTQTAAAYDEPTLARLREIADAFDPDGVLLDHHTIRPAS